MRPLRQLEIEPDHVALIGSGPSITAMPPKELAYLRSRCFVITLNYAPLGLRSDLNIWSDRRVGEFLACHYGDRPKDRLLATQESQSRGLEDLVDLVFDRRRDGLLGNFTLVWVLQLLLKYFDSKRVLLFGVDHQANDPSAIKWYDRLTDHDVLQRGRHFDAQRKLAQCAEQLSLYCRSDRVVNCTPGSALEVYERRDWRELLPIRVAQLTPTPLAGAPAHLSRIINRYTVHTSTSVLRQGRDSRRRSNLWWEYDLHAPDAEALDDVVGAADVLHLHGRPYPADLAGKPALLQYHTPRGSYRPHRTDSRFNGRKLVIAQYHPRIYTDALIVPNLIDINDPSLLPEPKSEDRVRIFYSWATEVPGGWSDKGSQQTRKILNRTAERFGQRVEIIVKTDRPYHECLAAKRSADICIDECVTGSYHLQSLEGCSVGAVTLNAMDQTTAGFLRQATQASGHPFTVTSLERLEEVLCGLIGDRATLRAGQRAARAWMERWWEPRLRVQAYLRAYFDILMYGELQAGAAPDEGARPPPPVASAVPATIMRAEPRRQVTAAYVPQLRAPAAGIRGRLRRVQRGRGNAIPHIGALARSTAPAWRDPDPVGRPVEALHGRFRGRCFYIFGCGPSLVTARPKIPKDAVSIGVNFAFEHVPALDFNMLHSEEVFAAVRDVLDPATLLLPETLVSVSTPAGRQPQRRPPLLQQATVYPLQDPNLLSAVGKHVRTHRDSRILTWSSVAHSAIHIAAYMGASSIRLIGMDCMPFPDGRVHFDTPLWPGYGEQRWSANERHLEGIDCATQALAKQGVEVTRVVAAE